ncbi:MAG: tail fiber domain-containing protein, partial [Chloroflexota bacterium]
LTMGSTTISESEIGVLDGVTAGTAAASKAVVLDANKDIATIRNLTATNITGTLQTAAQANITSVGTLTSITTSGDLTIGSTTISESEIGVLDNVTAGTAAASKAVVLDANKDIATIRNLTATNLTGTLQTAAQPNITSVGTLTSITTSGTLTMGSTTISESEIEVLDGITAGTAGASKALVLDANSDISGIDSLSATSLTGELQTAAQPNITSVGTLTSITTSGDLTIGSTTISESEIGVLDGVTPGTASASKALVLDVDSNIIDINSLTASSLVATDLTLSSTTISASEIGVLDGVTAGTAAASKAVVLDANKDIATIRNLTAVNLTGTLQTAAQANITSVGTLTSITTSGALTMGSTTISESEIGVLDSVTPGTAAASKAVVLDANKDIATIRNLTATNLTGTLQTAAQPNITSVGTLTSITTSGTLTMGSTTISAAEIGVIDGVTPGTASASKALVLDDNLDISGIDSLSATSLTGTLQTAAQPNITSVGTLTSITTSGDLTIGSTDISESEIGVLDGVTPGTASASKALVLDVDSNIIDINSLTASSLVATDLTLSSTTISASEIGVLDGVTPGTAAASKAVVLDVNKDIATIRNLTAVNLTGTLQTAAQANITSVGTLTSITTSGTLTIGSTTISESEIGVLDSVTPGTAAASKAVVLDANKDIATIRNLTATNLTGTLQTAAQANITSVGTLTSITTSGTLTMGSTTISESEIGVLDSVTPGTAAASKAVVLDANKDIATIRNLTATNLTGTLQTAAQPNITSVGTLTSITTSGDLTIGSTDISESEIGVIDGVTAGTAAASKALVLDSSSDISGINSLGAGVLSIGSPANSNLPVEIGYTSYQYSGAYAYNNNSNAHGLVDAGNGDTANYSLRTDGRILATGELELTSDRRMKKNIAELTYDLSKKFVMTTTPVKFNWITGDTKTEFGYIAQDVLKAGFD